VRHTAYTSFPLPAAQINHDVGPHIVYEYSDMGKIDGHRPNYEVRFSPILEARYAVPKIFLKILWLSLQLSTRSYLQVSRYESVTTAAKVTSRDCNRSIGLSIYVRASMRFTIVIGACDSARTRLSPSNPNLSNFMSLL